MKIFKWIHRKLHSGTDYSRVSHENAPDIRLVMESGNDKDAMLVAYESEMDTDGLLLHMLSSMLSVGTLGHANLLCSLPDQEEEEEEEEEEPSAEESGEQDLKVTTTTTTQLLTQPDDRSCSEIEVKKIVVTEEGNTEPLLKEYSKDRREGRTTLAELFAVDPVITILKDNASTRSPAPMKTVKKVKPKLQKKGNNSLSFATHKLQMISRMLKKRIHPDQVVVRGGSSDDVGDGDGSGLLPQHYEK